MTGDPRPLRALIPIWGRTAEAAALTLLGSGLRRGVAFPRWRRLLGTAGPVSEEVQRLGHLPPTATAGVERDIAVALRSAKRRLPYQPLCLDTAAAGQAMLRRRGRRGTVVIGLAPGDERWGAHAWLLGDTGPMAGVQESRGFHPVTAFRPGGVPSRETETLVTWLRHVLSVETGGSSGPAPGSADVSPAAVVREAARHRVASILYGHKDLLPLDDGARAALATARRREVSAAMRAIAGHVHVSRVLATAGVRALFVKGVALAAATTGDPTGRGGGDVDVLVAPEDVIRAHVALLDAGAEFVPGMIPEPGSPLWPTAQRLRPEAVYRWNGLPVELHWRLDPAAGIMAIPFDELWARRRTLDIAAAPLDTLGDDDALLLTLAHGTREHWRQLRWVVDAVRQLSAVQDDAWTGLRVRAVGAGCDPALGVGLAVAERLSGRRLSGAVRPGVRARAIGDQAWRECLTGTSAFTAYDPGGIASFLSYAWRVAPDGAARWSHVREALFPVADMAQAPLPATLVVAYIPLRPALWLRRRARARRPGRPNVGGLPARGAIGINSGCVPSARQATGMPPR